MNDLDGLESAREHVKGERRWGEEEERKRTHSWARRNHGLNNIGAYLVLVRVAQDASRDPTEGLRGRAAIPLGQRRTRTRACY